MRLRRFTTGFLTIRLQKKGGNALNRAISGDIFSITSGTPNYRLARRRVVRASGPARFSIFFYCVPKYIKICRPVLSREYLRLDFANY